MNAETTNAEDVRSTDWMGLPSAELDVLLETTSKLADDLESKNPYGAEADGWRVRKLIEIVKACRPIKQIADSEQMPNERK